MMAAESTAGGVSLAWLLEGLAIAPLPDVMVHGLQTDSRQVRPGDLFLACAGLQVHALAFVEQALQRGAVAVAWEPAAVQPGGLAVPAVAISGLGHRLGLIADRFYGQPSADMHVIGVTGTDGKTSVSHFIAQALSVEASCGLLGTLGYGVYGALQPPSHTTPDALRLHAELAALRDGGTRQLAMEVSSHALHQQRVAGVAFNTAVLTQLSRDHLDYHGSVAAYAEAKRRLFRMPGLETAVLNAGDEFGRLLIRELAGRVPVIAYGRMQDDCRTRAADWIELESVEARADGIAMQLVTSRGRARLDARLLGAFNAENLMAALGALLARGLSLDQAVSRLRHVKTVAGRMELVSTPGVARAVVDYAHTPHALETALQALRPHCRGELICVFGAGGDRDSGKRPHMGAVAERCADRIVLTSDNPRSEDPRAIVEAILAGFEQPQRAACILDRGQAIETAITLAGKDDLVLVAGKGHEEYQQIGSRRVAFSDREWVRECLRRRAG
jgi:UDP-N-acetylmuramoyl-L-alanyl-D-glutamate--2,6-diaminopimelate ligase